MHSCRLMDKPLGFDPKVAGSNPVENTNETV